MSAKEREKKEKEIVLYGSSYPRPPSPAPPSSRRTHELKQVTGDSLINAGARSPLSPHAYWGRRKKRKKRKQKRMGKKIEKSEKGKGDK